MTLTEFYNSLKTQANANGKVILDSSIFSAEILQDMSSVLNRGSQMSLEISEITRDKIVLEHDEPLRITDGTVSIFNSNNCVFSAEFFEKDRQIRAVLNFQMPSDWALTDGFANLRGFPYNELAISDVQFVYATHPELHRKEGAQEKPAQSTLLPGLNLRSSVSLKNAELLNKLVRSKHPIPSFSVTGPFSPSKRQSLPVARLKAPLLDAPLNIGTGAFKLSLGAPTLVIENTPAVSPYHLQRTNYFLETSLDDKLDIIIGLPRRQGSFLISCAPLAHSASVGDIIEILPGGKGFRNFIPHELNSLFSEIGLDSFTMVLDRKLSVGSVSLAISTLDPWTVINDILILERLTLKLLIVDPGGLNSKQVNFGATAKFLPHIFHGEWGFSVALRQQSKAWEIDQVSGNYWGVVNLGDIVSGLLGSSHSAPKALHAVNFSDFGITATRSSPSESFEYRFHGTAETSIPMLGETLSALLTINAVQTPAGHEVTLDGNFKIGAETFQVSLDLGDENSVLTAHWKMTGEALTFEDIASAFGLDLPEIPDSFDLGLKSADFSYDFHNNLVAIDAVSETFGTVVFVAMKVKGKYHYCIGVDVNGSLSLRDLPLVGDKLPMNHSISIDELGLAYSSEIFSQNETQGVNGALKSLGINNKFPKSGLKKGFKLSANMQLGGPVHKIAIDVQTKEKPTKKPAIKKPGRTITPSSISESAKTLSNDSDKPSPDQTSSELAPSDGTHWLGVQKKLGPLYLDKIGLNFKDGDLWIIPYAEFTISGLTISLDGLAVSTPLDRFSPSFHLTGLGIDFKKGPIEIGGGFLKSEDAGTDVFYGMVVLKTETLSLSAMGSYAYLDHQPSMFIYLDVDYPIGGPPFFFVTGLTGGFGYNRALRVPAIDQLNSFPLIPSASEDKDDATKHHSAAAVKESLGTKLSSMKRYIYPEIGEQWFAAGVKFTSFEIINGFALLTIAFGHRFEVHLLGKATFDYPPSGTSDEADPLTRINILIRGAYLPDEGTIELRAAVDSGSFVFDPNCHLTGGLAFKSWLKGDNKDEFVFTLGGYHPKFNIPDYYPKVDRLGFNWNVSDQMTIKGGMYFAMTGHVLMAGGFLDAIWDSGALKAWLKITADFLVAYKPFHYDATMSIDIGAEVTIHFFGTHHISVNLGADLHIWGPSFSGTASFDIWVASFSVSFGSGRQKPPALDWMDFRKSFLPKTSPYLGATVTDGLVFDLKAYEMTSDFDVIPSQNPISHHWVINPKHFEVTVNCVIPIGAAPGVKSDKPQIGKLFGVKPMELKLGEVYSDARVEIWHEDSLDPVTDHFDIKLHTRNVPAGLWGASDTHDVHAHPTVKNVSTSFRIKPANPIKVGPTHPIERRNMLFEMEMAHNDFEWESIPADGGSEWVDLGSSWTPELTPEKFEAAAGLSRNNSLIDQFFDESEKADFTGIVAAQALTLLGRTIGVKGNG